MKIFMCIIFFLFTFCCYSQSFNIDGSIATDSKNNMFIYNLCPGIGYSLTDKDYLHVGIKFQSYSLIPKYERLEDDLWSTKTVLNFLVYGGLRYQFPIIEIKKETDYKQVIGFFPEFRLYYNPYVPRKIKYINDNDLYLNVSGAYDTQLAYSLGIGIYINSIDNDEYLAIRFEYSTIDAFKTLRTLSYRNKHFDFPTKDQWSVGLSIFIW